MRRTLKDLSTEPPSQLVGTLAIAGFAAEVNLRNVAEALGEKDLAMLAAAPERNAKLGRLRIEIDEQVATEISKVIVGTRELKRLQLTVEMALMFEQLGDHTVSFGATKLRTASPDQTKPLDRN